MNKNILYIIILIFLVNCSFTKKDGNKNDELVDIFKNDDPIQEELNSDIKIKKINKFRNDPFFNNNSNNSGNINFETSLDKISIFKFNKIKKFNSTQPELFFTNSNEIIFFNGKGTIIKLNEDLNKVWETNNYSKKEKKLSPILYFAQVKNILIVNDTVSKMYAINLNDGNIIWTKYSPSSFNSNVKVFKDIYFSIDFDNVIRAFSSTNGEEIWNFSTENSFIKSEKKLSLIIKDEIVFFINNLGDITALDVNNGALIWQTPTQNNKIYQEAFSLENSDLVFENDTIYFSNNKNEFFSIDARSGIIKWIQSINSNLRPTVIDGLVYTISNEGYLFIIDDNTGNVIRITDVIKNLKNRADINPTGFIHCKNNIFLSLSNGRLILINSSTGVQEKIYKLSNSKISRPYIFNNSMYLIRDNAIVKIN